MKRFCVLVFALLLWSGPRLFAEDGSSVQRSTAASVVSNGPAADSFVWPVSSQIGTKKISIVSKFGRRKLPLIEGSTAPISGLPAEEMHEGVDFGVPADSYVRAARTGKVLFAGFSAAYVSREDKKDKNHLVIIRHVDGTSTRYVHLDRLMVRPGQEVKAGDILGKSSDSDEWTEPVVHFEIRSASGKALNPLDYLGKAAPSTEKTGS